VGATCKVRHWRISGKAAGKALNHKSGDLPVLEGSLYLPMERVVPGHFLCRVIILDYLQSLLGLEVFYADY